MPWVVIGATSAADIRGIRQISKMHKEKHIVLGDSLTSFMEELGIVLTGGRWGSITRLKEQLTRLFVCSISYKVDDGGGLSLHNTILVSDINLWWDARNPDQTNIWES